MYVKILDISQNKLVTASINEGKGKMLPSTQQGWRFNFKVLVKNVPDSKVYILSREETPDVIEGCMIFQMKKKITPYVAYLEISPHNKYNPRKYDYAGDCLIAFAYRLSLLYGKGDYKGWLVFEVKESDPDTQKKLMNFYKEKYKATIMDETTLIISNEAGDDLIEKYLERKIID